MTVRRCSLNKVKVEHSHYLPRNKSQICLTNSGFFSKNLKHKFNVIYEGESGWFEKLCEILREKETWATSIILGNESTQIIVSSIINQSFRPSLPHTRLNIINTSSSVRTLFSASKQKSSFVLYNFVLALVYQLYNYLTSNLIFSSQF